MRQISDSNLWFDVRPLGSKENVKYMEADRRLKIWQVSPRQREDYRLLSLFHESLCLDTENLRAIVCHSKRSFENEKSCGMLLKPEGPGCHLR